MYVRGDDMKIEMTPSIEDYLETIYRLDKGVGVRSIDVARIMNVSKPSVNRAIKTLISHDYVSQQPYQNVILTDKGREKAQELNMRYSILKGFLIHILGVPTERAEKEANFMEHGMSADTINRIGYLMRDYSLRESESKFKAAQSESIETGKTKI